jgi:hypothetical protein
MIKNVKGVDILPGRPSSTIALFHDEDLAVLCGQPGATGRGLVRFRHTDGKEYDAAVGRNSHGLMLDPLHKIALPCPPVCPGGKFSFTNDC